MMNYWLLLALLAQAADAALSCDRLRGPRPYRELNPILGQSCARVVGVKAATIGAILLSPSGRAAGDSSA
jgi:hypothetical protein